MRANYECAVRRLAPYDKAQLKQALTDLHRAQLIYLTSGYSRATRGNLRDGLVSCYLRNCWGLCVIFGFEAPKSAELLTLLMDNIYIGSYYPPVEDSAYLPVQDYQGNWHSGGQTNRKGELSPHFSLAIRTRTTLLNLMIQALEEAIDKKG